MHACITQQKYTTIKISNVMPVHKKGFESDPGNHQPVSLTMQYFLQNSGTH